MLSREENEYLTRVGPGTPMGELFRRFWLPAATIEDLPEPDCDPIRTRILGEDLVGFRDSTGQVGFVDAYCPHRRAPMFMGRNEEGGLRCVYHGWKFNVHGSCMDMPSEPPDSDFRDRLRIQAYPVRQKGPVFWIYMGPPEKMPELPDLEWTETEGRVVKWLQEANYMQALEGNIDTAHVNYLHSMFVDDDGSGFSAGAAGGVLRDVANVDRQPRLQVMETEYGFAYGGRRDLGNGEYYWRVSQWLLPTHSMIPAPVWSPSGSVWVPIDDHHSYRYVFQRRGRIRRNWLETRREQFKLEDGTIIDAVVSTLNKSNYYEMDRQMQRTVNYTGIRVGTIQDQAVVEGQTYVTDRTKEHLGTTDTAIIAARRRLVRAARALEQGVEPFPAQHGDLYRVRPIDIVSTESELPALLEKHAEWVNAREPIAVG
jgi:phthalate 4,5-dioxygenase oxygenase subunit